MIIGDSSISFSSRFLRTSLRVVRIEPGFKVFTIFNRYCLSLKMLLTQMKLTGINIFWIGRKIKLNQLIIFNASPDSLCTEFFKVRYFSYSHYLILLQKKFPTCEYIFSKFRCKFSETWTVEIHLIYQKISKNASVWNLSSKYGWSYPFLTLLLRPLLWLLLLILLL